MIAARPRSGDPKQTIARRESLRAQVVENEAVVDVLERVITHAAAVAVRAGCRVADLIVNGFLTPTGRIIVHFTPPGLAIEECPTCARRVDLDDEQLAEADPDDSREPCYDCGAFVDDDHVL